MFKAVISEETKMRMARQIAKDGGCFVVSMGTIAKPKYLLYRESREVGVKNQLVGKRSSAQGILNLAKTATNFK